ncbi:hypothetical protein WICPIJ_004763 [Wickerhamomyces pijperi]|uniref:Uncharacterized protein n=1 Tax=Wickerhamomyces pijperi TaxID=599730 RepID=A0A9P8TMK8_WICPI|nr:hypothetical protein WICPIJ_004763 [Wickerhamomyces pijperi]
MPVPAPSPSPGLLSTADYAISIAYPNTAAAKTKSKSKVPASSIEPTEEAAVNLAKLLTVLNHNKKFQTQIRPGETKDSLIVFVRVKDSVLLQWIQKVKANDFLYNNTTTNGLALDVNSISDEGVTESQRSSMAYQILTLPLHEGGLGLTPGFGEWTFIKRVIPIYSEASSNSALFSSILKKAFVDDSDIDQIKDIAGEKVGLYFHFLNHYINWLIVLAVAGVASHLFVGRYSVIYTVFSILWGVLFTNSWTHKQFKVALKWGTKDTNVLHHKRYDFKGESNEIDPVTNEFKAYYPDYKRTITKAGFIPVALLAIGVLFVYQFACFLVEIFVNEIYQGPGKAVLGLAPTVLLVVGIPIFTQVYQKIVDAYMKNENHEYQETYQKSFLEKMYVYVFLAQYSALFITILFYIPMGYTFNAYLPWIYQNTHKWGIPINHEFFKINSERLINQYNYFIVTNQVVGFLTENVVPEAISYAKSSIFNDKEAGLLDTAAESKFLASVRSQLVKPVFDTDAEYRELSVHFGYIILFSSIWPLAPLISLIFLWVEFRGDLYKLLYQSSKPIPERANKSKPWTGNFKFLVWLGSIVMPLITFMFRGFDSYIASEKYDFMRSSLEYVSGYKLFFVVFVSENLLYVWANQIMESLMEKMNRKANESQNKKTVLLRKQQLERVTIEEPKDDFAFDHFSSQWVKCDVQKELDQAASLPSLLQSAKDAKNGIDKNPKQEELILDEKKASEKQQVGTNTTTGASRFNQQDDSTQKNGTVVNRKAATDFAAQRSNTSSIPLETSSANVSAPVPTSAGSAASAVAANTTAPISEIKMNSSNSSHGSLNGATLPPNFPLDSAGRKKLLEDQNGSVVSPTANGVAHEATQPDETATQIPQSKLNGQSVSSVVDSADASKVDDVPEPISKATAADDADSLNAASPKFQRDQLVSDLKDLEYKAGEFTSSDSTPTKKKKSVFGIIKNKVTHGPSNSGHSHGIPSIIGGKKKAKSDSISSQ